MNFFLVTFALLSYLAMLGMGAPAVSKVHVSFGDGDKATKFTQELEEETQTVQYVSKDDSSIATGDHDRSKRSFSQVVAEAETDIMSTTEKLRNFLTQNRPGASTIRSTSALKDATDKPETAMDGGAEVPEMPSSVKKKRVRFVKGSNAKEPLEDDTTPSSWPSSSSKPQTDIDKTKSKDTKAVKRSPFFGGNFIGGVDFPDFDDFAGNGFVPSGRFGSSHRNSGHRASYSQHNPEALAPEGVFYPPVPTQEATNYVENDPYLADPETAKYAAQRPPFFHEFPHKRTVLALNERREDNGLEQNLLRSIRPYFPFFEIHNHNRPRHPFNRHAGYHHPHPPYFFDDLGPAVIFYANQIRPRVDPLSLYAV